MQQTGKTSLQPNWPKCPKDEIPIAKRPNPFPPEFPQHFLALYCTIWVKRCDKTKYLLMKGRKEVYDTKTQYEKDKGNIDNSTNKPGRK